MLEKLIRKIAQSLDRKDIPYMIIGGQAVLLYGSPRLTRDIDITLGTDTDKFSTLKEICKELGLKILIEKPQDFVKRHMVLPAEEKNLKIRVDFIFSYSFYEREAIKRAKVVRLGGYPIRFASCEDLIIHKLFAGRAVDLEDIKIILLKNKADLKYIKRRLKDFSGLPEQQDILDNFNRIVKDLRKSRA